MCSCTHDDPHLCDARLGRQACTCTCHRHWKPRAKKAPASQGPRQPLDEKDAEIERLRGELSYVATCLYRTQWGDEKDDEYATALASHIIKHLGHNTPPQDTGDYEKGANKDE